KANVPTYAKVKYEKVYPGIDLVYHGDSQHKLEYDFEVGGGSDAGTIELAFAGADSIGLNRRGDLVIRIGGGEVVEQAPVIYQETDGRWRRIAGGYLLKRKNHVGLKLAAYDRQKPLVIDPTLVYSTYLGGSDSDGGAGIAVDCRGDAYITGYAYSTNFPT